MAVRIFEASETQSSRLTILEPAPLRRQDLRRLRQRYAIIGVASLVVPFAAALVVLGVVH
jgi:hypothetical protein